MKAKDFFEEKKPNMRELWNLSDTQKETIYSLMEKYASLCQPLVVGQSEQLVCYNHHADLEHFINYSESICKTCKQKV